MTRQLPKSDTNNVIGMILDGYRSSESEENRFCEAISQCEIMNFFQEYKIILHNLYNINSTSNNIRDLAFMKDRSPSLPSAPINLTHEASYYIPNLYI